MRSKDTILGTHRNSSNWPEDRERLFLEVAIDARDMLSCIDDRLEQLVILSTTKGVLVTKGGKQNVDD